MPETINWKDIWVALQELGAALRPLLDSGNVPDWAVRLSDALDDAEPRVAARCSDG